MEQKKIDRINFLARKSRAQGLTSDEKEEQEKLRMEYRQSIIGNLKSQLDNTYIVEKDGSKTKVKSKKERNMNE